MSNNLKSKLATIFICLLLTAATIWVANLIIEDINFFIKPHEITYTDSFTIIYAGGDSSPVEYTYTVGTQSYHNRLEFDDTVLFIYRLLGDEMQYAVIYLRDKPDHSAIISLLILELLGLLFLILITAACMLLSFYYIFKKGAEPPPSSTPIHRKGKTNNLD